MPKNLLSLRFGGGGASYLRYRFIFSTYSSSNFSLLGWFIS